MTLNWKMWTLIGIVAVAAIIAAGVWKQFGPREPAVESDRAGQEAPITVSQDLPAAAVEPATGNIDDAVNAILAGAADDEASFADTANDAALVGADSQTITNLGQSFYENEI